MTKLSIVLTEEQGRALRKIAFDRKIHFQNWVRARVLGLLETAENERPIDAKTARAIQQLDSIRKADPLIASAVESMIGTIARRLNGHPGNNAISAEAAGVAEGVRATMEGITGGPVIGPRGAEKAHRDELADDGRNGGKVKRVVPIRNPDAPL